MRSPEAFDWVESGGHRASVRAVAERRADLATIDAVSWAFATRFELDAASRLRLVARTPPRPALPFITAGGRSDKEMAALCRALSDALANSDTEEPQKALGLLYIAVRTPADYEPLAALMR